MSEQKVEEISIDGDTVRIVLTVDKKDLMQQRDIFDYTTRENIQREVIRLVAQEVFAQKKDEIIKTVLTDVNWAELVRSEIAKKVIQEAARGNY